MTANAETDRTAARLREAVQELARLAGSAGSGDAGHIDEWAELASDLADRYHVHVDRLDARRPPRFVAVARDLHIRPYAVVTGDAEELRAMLCVPSRWRTEHERHRDQAR